MTILARFTIAALLAVAAFGSHAQSAPLSASSRRAVEQVVAGALEQTGTTRIYDSAYVRIAYPNGDPPADRGVCSDVIVRAFRKAGIDLKKEIHEDMARSFSAYPSRWHASGPDANIDHRRVPNLMTYFARKGRSLPAGTRAEDYAPGDVVAWDLGGGVLHVGVVSDIPAPGSDHYQIVHNIGAGARLEDVLFSWKLIGHYRYFQ